MELYAWGYQIIYTIDSGKLPRGIFVSNWVWRLIATLEQLPGAVNVFKL
jgi:hypothetical protein